MLPAVLVAYDLAERRERVVPRTYAPFVLVAGLYLVVRFTVLGGLTPAPTHGDLGRLSLVLTPLTLFATYLGKLVVPTGLTFFHVLDPVRSLADWRLVPAALVGASLAGAGLWSVRHAPRVLLGLALLVLPLLPAMHLPALGENAFAERYLYLPSAGMALLVAVAVDRVIRLQPRRATAILTACLTVVLVFAAMTVARNRVWRDDETLWRDAAEKAPCAAYPRAALGAALLRAGDPGAVTELERAVELRATASALNNLGLAYQQAGRGQDAVAAFAAAAETAPTNVGVLLNLGDALAAHGDLAGALAAYRRSLQHDPGYAPAWNAIGVAYARGGRLDAAAEYFARAAELDPADPAYRDNLSRAAQR